MRYLRSTAIRFDSRDFNLLFDDWVVGEFFCDLRLELNLLDEVVVIQHVWVIGRTHMDLTFFI